MTGVQTCALPIWLEALPQRIQRTGPDVAVDDAEREECEFCETAAARVGFLFESADLRDLKRLFTPTVWLVGFDLGISASDEAFAR